MPFATRPDPRTRRLGGPRPTTPDGAFTYSKIFDVPLEWLGRIIRLNFGGAMRHAMVFVNNELAGNHADGYARFWVDITPFVKFGQDNVVRVEVRTGRDSRWYSGTGLIRPVQLRVDEPLHILPDGIAVTTVRLEEDQAVVEVVTTVANAGLVTGDTSVLTRLTSPDGTRADSDRTPVTVPPGASCLVRQRFYLPGALLWSDLDPNLYTATVSLLGADPATKEPVPFGIRTITADPRKGLLLNGRPILLRGACIHHDNGPLGAAAIGRAEERRVERLKAAALQRAPDRAQPRLGGHARRLRPARHAGDGRGLRHVGSRQDAL